MLSLPSAGRVLLMSFSVAFTRPTFGRVLWLIAGAILALGDRTVTGMLRGFETPRQHVAASVLRTALCLLGLFTIICLIFTEHTRRHRVAIRQSPWYHKDEPTFADAIAAVRRLFWQESLFHDPCYRSLLKDLSPKLRTWMLDQLCQAA